MTRLAAFAVASALTATLPAFAQSATNDFGPLLTPKNSVSLMPR